MPRVSLAFFGAGVLCVLVGMSMGMWMGANQNFGKVVLKVAD